MASSLVSGSKEKLLKEFKLLKSIHGNRWRSLLKSFNNWHNTVEGLYAWQNAFRGSVGNEALRKIVGDMRTIVKNEESKKLKETPENKLSPKKMEAIRNKAIKDSIQNLKPKEKVKSKKVKK